MGGNNEFFENFERNKYLKKLPSMQRVKGSYNSMNEDFVCLCGLVLILFCKDRTGKSSPDV